MGLVINILFALEILLITRVAYIAVTPVKFKKLPKPISIEVHPNYVRYFRK